MLKQIFAGLVTSTLLAPPFALAHSSGADQEAAAETLSHEYGQAPVDGHIGTGEQINAGQLAAEPAIGLVEVQVPEAALDRLAGKYTAQDKSMVLVTRAGTRLAADLAGISLEFSASGPNEFFIPGSPLTLSFAPGEAGKAQGLTVKENGMVIMQATAPR